MIIPKKVRLKHVAFRLLPDVHSMVTKLAEEQGVKESEIYRYIVTHFFYPEGTQKVYDKGNKEMTNEEA